MTASAATACPACGRGARQDARFCDGCGSPIASSAATAEYKQVTVLFADVVHSMEIAAAVAAERLRENMTDLVERARRVVQRYGGTVDKFTGIMAVFGAPAALEDHAVRACLAALGIQDETAQLATEVNDRDGIGLQLRVGLNSGQVIAGETGSGQPIADIHVAAENTRTGDFDDAVSLLREVVYGLYDTGGSIWCALATAALVEALVKRGGEGDLGEAAAAIERVGVWPTDPGYVLNEITLLRLRALLAQARGEAASYRDYRDRYRAMAKSLSFEGHINWAEAMP